MTTTQLSQVERASVVDPDTVRDYRALIRTALALPTADPTRASPLHAFLLCSETFEAVISGLCTEPPTIVHLSQEMRNTRLVRPGEQLRTRAQVIAVRREPRGLRAALRCSVLAQDAEVSTLAANVLLIGASAPDPWGEVPSPVPTSSTRPGPTTILALSREFVQRYAGLASDHNPIHIDDAAARAAGFPRAIAHGMSMLAVAAEQIVEQCAAGDPERLRGIGTRFSAPIHPDEPVSIDIGTSDDGAEVAFTCRTERGHALKGGWARLAPGGGRG